ncbi:MAG: sigma-70 family RNA polymerase sigma factor [Bacteroidales bacterium]|jgi:RNA polymerase sigma-70 factor (ECF subfamily)|nr:sigma-70 family RNA polymerase sigma factor [Bacteroidales bacterium]MDD3166980.1 sigma-70 family RNA polymerase sigma factor [Bacteroidales bacterium]MDD4769965.1 sigma-70 family RNA polymerase sigma factor [Bacteroidales bacterium]
MDDATLINAFLQGDSTAFTELVHRYQDKVFRIAMGYLHNQEEAEDLSQEIFIVVYQSLHQYKGEAAFSTWLYRVSINTTLQHLRKIKRRTLFLRFLGKEEEGADLVSNEDPEKDLLNKEAQKRVKSILNRLPINQRTAFILKQYESLSQKEIARIMKISEGAVEALLQRAKKNLKKIQL